jgi:hypothetical protein
MPAYMQGAQVLTAKTACDWTEGENAVQRVDAAT